MSASFHCYPVLSQQGLPMCAILVHRQIFMALNGIFLRRKLSDPVAGFHVLVFIILSFATMRAFVYPTILLHIKPGLSRIFMWLSDKDPYILEDKCPAEWIVLQTERLYVVTEF